ncbi:hypothetical protein ABPG77_007371 [Micractinium sp. CCAP 211/92]
MAGLSAGYPEGISQPDEVLAPAQPAANGVADPPAAPPPPLGAAAVTSGAVGAAAQHVHALRAFSRRQAAAWALWDVTSSLLLALLFALASSVARWRARGWSTTGAGLAQLALLLTPGLLSAASPRRWYLARRHWVSAACRLLSLRLYEHVTPLALLLPREWGGSWAATLKLLAFLRLPSLSMMAWAYRMPLPLLAAVHLLATLEAVHISFSAICPLLCNVEGQAQLRRLAGMAKFLTMLSPIPSAAAAERTVADGAFAPVSHGLTLCRQTTLWLLLCFGYTFPMVCQWLCQVESKRSYVQR